MEGIYLPLWAALPSYPTRRGTRPPAAVRARGARPHGALTLCGAPFQGTRPARLEGARRAGGGRLPLQAATRAPPPPPPGGGGGGGGRTSNLGCCRFARRYWGNPGWFLFLRLLICLSSAGSPARSEADAWRRACGRPPKPPPPSVRPAGRSRRGRMLRPTCVPGGKVRMRPGASSRAAGRGLARAARQMHLGAPRRTGRSAAAANAARAGRGSVSRRRSDGQARRVAGGRNVRSKTRWLAGSLQFAPRIACRRVLHRRRSQEIRCRGLCWPPCRGPNDSETTLLQGRGRAARGHGLEGRKETERVRRARRPGSPL